MADREQTAYMLKMTTSTIRTLIEDVGEDESMIRGEHGFNHIRWQTGHLFHIYHSILRLLGVEKSDTEKIKALFDFGTYISDEADDYPPMADIRANLLEIMAEAEKAAETVADDILDREVNRVDGKIGTGHLLSFLCMHNWYHAGQITHLRKILGRPRPFV